MTPYRYAHFLVATALVIGAPASAQPHAAARKPTVEPASAAAAPASDSAAAAAAPLTATVFPLARLSSTEGPLRIQGSSGEESLSVPLGAREVAQAAILHLVATNSSALLDERSQLVVRLNDRTLAQFALSPHQPELTADIRLPAGLLKAGYNALSFVVAQHATEQCENPSSPELWTEIDTTRSTLQLQSDLKPLSPTLADLGDLIDPRQQFPRQINIVTAAHPGDDDALSAGGLVAQGVALRLRYLPYAAQQMDAQSGSGAGLVPGLALTGLANADNLLIGTKAQLRPFLSAEVLQHIQGGFLGVYPMPGDPRHFLLLVAGTTEAEVKLAASVFAALRLPLPPQAEMTITGMNRDPLAAYQSPGRMSQPGIYQFKQLGYVTHTVGDNGSRSADLEVNLPADTYAHENAAMEFDLNFAEGAKMRADSVMNIYLNGKFQSVIALDQDQGGLLQHYRISIPLRTFNAGHNTLSFRPSMMSLITGNCAYLQHDNLRVTVFDDSTVTLPAIAHYAQLPNLRLLADGGFPYTTRSDGSQLAVQLAAHDSDTIGAAWSLLARMAQDQAMPLEAAQVTFGSNSDGRQVLLLGAQASLPAASLEGAPWQLSPQRIAGADLNLPVPAPLKGWIATQFEKITGISLYQNSGPAAPPTVSVTGSGAPARELLMMQYRSRLAGKPTVTVFTAATATELLHGMHKLIAPQYWTGLNGNVALLPLGDAPLQTLKFGGNYMDGTLNPVDYLGYLLSNHPWIWYALLVVLLLILAGITGKLVAAYQRRHHDTLEH